MTFLAGLVADLLEWLGSKLFAILGQDFAQWQANRKAAAALATNQTNLQNAIKSGDPSEIQQAGTSSLNNDGGN